MGRAEKGTPKAISNAIKARGLQKLRWYCQACEKQCRDENGFKCHTRTEGHLRNMLAVSEDPRRSVDEFSRQFQSGFIAILSQRYNTKRVLANRVYQDYIADKQHVHMNATRWVTLAGFARSMAKAGVVRVEEDEQGLWISWIDKSPQALAKTDAAQKRARAEEDDHTRERREIEQQAKRAALLEPAPVEREAKPLQKTGSVSIRPVPRTDAGNTARPAPLKLR